MGIKLEVELSDENVNKIIDGLIKKGGDKIIDAVSKRKLEIDKNDINQQTLTVNQVAEKLGVNRKTVIEHITNKLLIASKPGKNYIITAENLKKYLDGNY